MNFTSSSPRFRSKARGRGDKNPEARAEADRRAVAVIGDGALPSGIVFEAMNNAAELKSDLLVILNDNKMGICPRVGGLATYLDKARVAPFYNGLKRDVSWLLNKLPMGETAHQAISQFKDALKGFLHGGMLFEELGFRYIGPVGQALGLLPQLNVMTADQLAQKFERAGFSIIHRWEPGRGKAAFMIAEKVA